MYLHLIYIIYHIVLLFWGRVQFQTLSIDTTLFWKKYALIFKSSPDIYLI